MIGIFVLERSGLVIIGGMGIGLFIVSLRILGIRMLGAGDGAVLVITGILLGFWKNMELLMVGLFLASLYGIGRIIKEGNQTKKEIPFIPFLFLGYVFQIVWNVGGG